jgi:branched-chain amino acid transport system permease protein
MTMFRTRGAAIMAFLGVALLLVTPLYGGDYLLSQLILIGIYGIAALGLNVLVGFTGQISLGHSAFFGFGAFASAWLGTAYHVPALLSIPIAGVMTTALGMIFGIPAARLKGLYLAIATLAAQFILEDFFGRADWFTGGSSGAPAERASLFGIPLDTDRTYFYVVLFWFVVSYVGVANLMRTRDGRALVAVRDHYLSAEVMGINLTRYRILSFGISSFFAGIGGALYAHYLGFVSAEAFTILLSIQFLAMIIIGGRRCDGGRGVSRDAARRRLYQGNVDRRGDHSVPDLRAGRPDSPLAVDPGQLQALSLLILRGDRCSRRQSDGPVRVPPRGETT